MKIQKAKTSIIKNINGKNDIRFKKANQEFGKFSGGGGSPKKSLQADFHFPPPPVFILTEFRKKTIIS